MSDEPSGQEELTPREQEILRLAREGLSNNEIADRLGLKHNALRFHLKHLHAKLMTDGQRAALASGGGRRWGWLPLAFTGWLAPTAAVAAVVVVSAGGYLAVRAASQSHDGDRAPSNATTEATVRASATPEVARGILIGTPTTITALGGNAALFGPFPDQTVPPTMTANIRSISPSHLGLVSQADTRTPDKTHPHGVCAEIALDAAAPNFQWFRMALDDADVTHDLTDVVRDGDTTARLCYAPTDGLATGVHFASLVVARPGTEVALQRVTWQFHVVP